MRARDRSIPRQEHILYGTAREPIRPWIEEVIALKRTEIQRKIVEREELEIVLLKATQIERKQILREQFQKIDLRSVQQYFGKAELSEILGIQEHELERLEKVQNEEDITILELTRQIDELVKRDTAKVEDRKYDQVVFKETITDVEDTIVLKLDESSISRTEAMRREQLQHTEESNILKLNRSQEIEQRQIEQREQEVPVAWRRGRKPKEPIHAQEIQHIEDRNILTVDRSEKTETAQQEVAVPWRRGKQSQEKETSVELSHLEDSNILQIDRRSQVETKQVEEVLQEQPVAWRRGGRKPEQQSKSQTTYVEDVSMVSVDTTESTEEKLQEVPTMWRRGKKPQETVAHVQETTKREEVEVVEESTVPWLRRKSKKDEKPEILETVRLRPTRKPKQVPSETVEPIEQETVQQLAVEPALSEEILEEKPVAWRRGQKMKPAAEPVEEKQWPTGKQRPKPEEEAETISLKPIPKQEVLSQEPQQSKPVEIAMQKQVPQPLDEVTEKVQLPKRKETTPKPKEEVEKVELKPVSRKVKVNEKKPTAEEEVQIVLKPLPKQPKEEFIEQPEILEDDVISVPTKKVVKKRKTVIPKQLSVEEVERSEEIVTEDESSTIVSEPKEDERQPVEEVMQQVKLPKRKGIVPQPKQEPEKVELKPIPRKTKPVEEKPAEEEEEVKLILKPLPKKIIPEEEQVVEQVQEEEEKVVVKTKKIIKKKKVKSQKQESTEEDTVEDEVIEETVEELVKEGQPISEPVQEVPVEKPKKILKEKPAEIIQTEEIVEELVTEEAPMTQMAPIVESETVTEKVQIEQKKTIKKKTKKTKQVVFNDELETFEAQTIEDESLDEEISRSSIQLKQTESKPDVTQQTDSHEEEFEYDSDFRKEITYKIMSNITKINRQVRFIGDEGQLLPELELITQKRIQEALERGEQITEDIIQQIQDELIAGVTEKKPKKPRKAPKFIKQLKPEICRPDRPAILQCKVDGVPFPEIKWFFNDIELFATENIRITVVDKTTTLEIVNVTPQHVGIYTCQARNEAGVATSKANIVLGKYMFYVVLFALHIKKYFVSWSLLRHNDRLCCQLCVIFMRLNCVIYSRILLKVMYAN